MQQRPRRGIVRYIPNSCPHDCYHHKTTKDFAPGGADAVWPAMQHAEALPSCQNPAQPRRTTSRAHSTTDQSALLQHSCCMCCNLLAQKAASFLCACPVLSAKACCGRNIDHLTARGLTGLTFVPSSTGCALRADSRSPCQ